MRCISIKPHKPFYAYANQIWKAHIYGGMYLYLQFHYIIKWEIQYHKDNKNSIPSNRSVISAANM